jgi:hypothetical protein
VVAAQPEALGHDARPVASPVNHAHEVESLVGAGQADGDSSYPSQADGRYAQWRRGVRLIAISTASGSRGSTIGIWTAPKVLELDEGTNVAQPGKNSMRSDEEEIGVAEA